MSSPQLLLHQTITCKSTLYLGLHVQHGNLLETLIHQMQLHTKQCVKNAWETKWGTLSVITVNIFLLDSRDILFSVSCRAAGIAFIWCSLHLVPSHNSSCWYLLSPGLLLTAKDTSKQSQLRMAAILAVVGLLCPPWDEKARSEEASEEEETTP